MEAVLWLWNIGPLVRIQGIMEKEYYLHTFQTNLPRSVDEWAYSIEEVVYSARRGSEAHCQDS